MADLQQRGVTWRRAGLVHTATAVSAVAVTSPARYVAPRRGGCSGRTRRTRSRSRTFQSRRHSRACMRWRGLHEPAARQ